MRILVGTVEIAGQIPVIADGFRQLGHQVTTVVRSRHSFYPEVDYDVDLTPKIRWPRSIAQARALPIRVPRYLVTQPARWSKLLPLIVTHDVFFFQYSSLLDNNRDYPLLQKLGKKIVSFFVGDDVRHPSAYDQQYGDQAGAKAGFKDMKEFGEEPPLIGPLHGLRMAERYSSLILSVPSQAGLAVRPFMRAWISMKLSKYRFSVPRRDIPVVVHAPSHKSWKGTDEILRTLERLRGEGVPFELRLLHGVPNQKVIAELADADVAIDQLNLFIYGKFTAEALASGCAVATGNREDLEPMPLNRPVWAINPATLYDQLRRLLTDKELRIRLAHEGRKYVERYHDHVQVAQYFIENLEQHPANQYHFYPTFFSRHYRLPEGERVPRYLQRMTAKIVQRWGLPEDADPYDMVARGLIAPADLNSLLAIPRWKDPVRLTT